MTKKDVPAVVRAFSKQYKQAKKKAKSELLHRLVKTTGYSRKHLMEILPNPPKVRKRKRRIQKSRYVYIFKPLLILWAVSNYACGKRLKPMIVQLLAALRRHKELIVTKDERILLLTISAATIDRLLTHDRKRINIKGRSRTKPGSLLKHQIPIKTWRDWDNATPGFMEIDSVHHCGGSLFGDYVYTLDTTDVATGWNECCGHIGRGEYRTIQALDTIRGRVTFPLLGIDFDCDGEFVNYHLVRYCNRNHITYTRAREGISNDQPYIEQQNYSVVRRFVGYQRLDTQRQLARVNRIYQLLPDYQNFFQPVMRLKTKVRDGAKVTRKYDVPLTAYQRVLKRKDIASHFHPINREQTGIVFSYTAEVDFNGKLYSFPLADGDFADEENISMQTEHPDFYGKPTVLDGYFTDTNGEEPRVILPCDSKNQQATLDLYAGIKIRIVPSEQAAGIENS